MLRIQNFIKWLKQNGCILLETTNEWEVVRFQSGERIGVVYKNKKGSNSFSDEWVRECVDAYKCNGYFNFDHKTKRKNTPSKKKRSQIALRDGSYCFYCNAPDHVDMTIEHLVPLVQGGPDNINNMVLACAHCNDAVGNLPLPEKLKLRDRWLNEKRT